MKTYLYFIVTIAMLFACSTKAPNPNKKTSQDANKNLVILNSPQIATANLKIGELATKPLSGILKLTGKIELPPQNIVSISAPLGGYVFFTNLLPGKHINRGEVIATIEDPQFIQLQQDYLTNNVKLIYAEAEFKRQKELNESKAASDKILQHAEMEMKNLQITKHALAEKLKLINVNPNLLTENNMSKRTVIYSPITGYVSKVNINIGKYVSPTDVLFELINPSNIHLSLKVFEKDLDKLYLNQPVMANTNHQPSVQHPCHINLISKALSEEGSTEVHCYFESYHQSLLPGMYMNASVKIQSQITATLPESAIVTYEGENYIFIQLKVGTYKMVAVETGIRENGFIEIKNATNFANNKIIIQNAYTLLMELKNTSEEE